MTARRIDAVDQPLATVALTEALARSRSSESWLALVGVRSWAGAGQGAASVPTRRGLLPGPDGDEGEHEGGGQNCGAGRGGDVGETDLHRRLARELHDAIGYNVSLVCIQAAVALDLIGGDSPGERLPGEGGPNLVREALLAIRQAGKDALQELRWVLGTLRQVRMASSVPTAPGLGRLDELVERFGESGLVVRVERVVAPAGGPLPEPVDAAFRIVQESLTNVVRHSGAATVRVRVVVDGGVLIVDVVNDGPLRQAPALVPSGGLGIIGMRERAVALGGRLDAGPRAGGGFGVRAELPLPGGGLGVAARCGGGGQRGAGGGTGCSPPQRTVTWRRP